MRRTMRRHWGNSLRKTSPSRTPSRPRTGHRRPTLPCSPEHTRASTERASSTTVSMPDRCWTLSTTVTARTASPRMGLRVTERGSMSRSMRHTTRGVPRCFKKVSACTTTVEHRRRTASHSDWTSSGKPSRTKHQSRASVTSGASRSRRRRRRSRYSSECRIHCSPADRGTRTRGLGTPTTFVGYSNAKRPASAASTVRRRIGVHVHGGSEHPPHSSDTRTRSVHRVAVLSLLELHGHASAVQSDR